jgi:hypothetical protein
MGQAVSPAPAPESPLDAVLAQLAELRDQVTLMEAAQHRDQERLDQLAAALSRKKAKTYEPVPAPRWWEASADERYDAIDRVRSWVDTVFRPGYGHLAAKLGECWEHHDLCLYLLDLLSESWTVMYKPEERDIGGLWSALDWHTRLLPGVVTLLEAETAACDHLPARSRQAGADPWAGAP